jgi:hypothetical protein
MPLEKGLGRFEKRKEDDAPFFENVYASQLLKKNPLFGIVQIMNRFE